MMSNKDVSADLAYWAVCALLAVSREPVATLTKDEPLGWADRAAPRVDEEYFTARVWNRHVILDDGPCGLEEIKL